MFGRCFYCGKYAELLQIENTSSGYCNNCTPLETDQEFNCGCIWSDNELYDFFRDNEDEVIIAASLSYCPECTEGVF